nr:aromatase/cyclase [Rhodococcus sp. (in: high G+C Gram-positive bacteria)]
MTERTRTISAVRTLPRERDAAGFSTTDHRIDVPVNPDLVFDALSDVTRWPLLLPPTVHAERLSGNDRRERIRIVATANESVKSWESLRTIDTGHRSITFRQTRSAPPVAFMDGRWVVDSNGAGGSVVILEHRFGATGPEHEQWLHETVDRNSRTELRALREALSDAAGNVVVEFSDSVVVHGNRRAVFDFVNDADRWPERLPHVAEVDFETVADGVQNLAMITRSPDGTTHRTQSYRVVLKDQSIVYKQFTLPPLMRRHLGRWTFVDDGDTTVATSHHAVVIDDSRIADQLGAAATVADAKAKVVAALSANSRATLELAKEYAERSRQP